MGERWAIESAEGFSHPVLGAAARHYLEQCVSPNEPRPDFCVLNAMLMSAFALEAYFNLVSAKLDAKGHLSQLAEFDRLPAREKYEDLCRRLGGAPDCDGMQGVKSIFSYRNKVVHAKPYSREDGQVRWKGHRPLCPQMTPPWVKQASASEARKFVSTMESVIAEMNHRLCELNLPDYPLDFFGEGSQIY